MQAAARLLQPEVLARLGTLDLVARTVVDGVMTGLHRAPHFGFSQEFAEYRAYSEGDDLRFVDWNVYARTDRTYIKRFQGETGTTLNLLVDASASMGIGEPVEKLQTARWLAASLCWLARRQRDALSLAVLDTGVRAVQPPSSRPDALPRALALLERTEAGEGTDLVATLHALRASITRRGLVVLISDLYNDPDTLVSALQPFAHAGQDIVLFRVLSPEEIEPSARRITTFEDIESGKTTIVDPRFLETRYRQRFAEHDAELERACRRVGAERITVRTDEPLDAALQLWLSVRARRGR